MKRSEDVDILRWYSNSVFDQLALCRMDKGQIDRHDDYLDLCCISEAQEEVLDTKNWIALETKKRKYPLSAVREIGKLCEQLYDKLEQLRTIRELKDTKPKEVSIIRDLRSRIESEFDDVPERYT
jgi:hypothetical protein